MGSSSTTSATFSLVILLVLLLQHDRFASADSSLIQKTCKATKYYALCMSSLKSDPTSLTADGKGLAAIIIEIATANATATSSYLSSQVLSSANDANAKKVLKECDDKYGYAGEALQGSLQDLAAESYDYAYMHINAAADYPNACHNAFRSFPALVYPPELARREDALKRICAVVLGIIDSFGWD
ncbi:cell wall / vacuolar inhibitor of fructosidase 2 [Argentina anserina]|uniref:cell wall / vacuolar inhibitor of fructosidase 2 n=1 Tax=Argentina anserina TaxID=57926 RepID=UPI00217683C4|nr:cell wall / vacuolar inhibitor of fructosidase 2 [Potentilla anserina]